MAETVAREIAQTGVTLNAMVSTALALVLGYESGSDDVVFGSTVAGRPTDLDGIDSVIGLFLTVLQLELIQRRADKALRRAKRGLEAALS